MPNGSLIPDWRPPSRNAMADVAGLALPASLAAMITPLLGIVDTAVLARGSITSEVAGVALASAVFSIVYWSLGFLRMAVAGLTAQADGRQDEAGARAHLVQGLAVGLFLGALLLVFRGPIADLSRILLGRGTEATPQALDAMEAYVEMRLLAAPFAVAFFACVGWLSGQGRTGLMMLVVAAVTGLNAALDVYFVLDLGQGAKGIARGTAIAEAAGLFLILGVIALVLRRRGGLMQYWDRDRWTENWRSVLSLNTDIFVRTFALAAVFFYFTRSGGGFGDMTLAANQVLMQVTLAAGLLLDGPAIAAEARIGRALGKTGPQRRADFLDAVRTTGWLATIGAVGLTLILFVFGGLILGAIVPPDSASTALNAEASRYYIWAALSPLFMLAPFHLDGIYIGATRGAALRNSMGGAAAIFAIAALSLPPIIGNHGLWLAFGLFMLARAAFLLWIWDGFEPLIEAGEPKSVC